MYTMANSLGYARKSYEIYNFVINKKKMSTIRRNSHFIKIFIITFFAFISLINYNFFLLFKLVTIF